MAYFTIMVFLVVYFLIVGQSILVPLAFGALFAFMLKPIVDFFERFIKWRIFSILMALISAIIPVSIVIYFFSSQFVDVVQDMPSIKEKLNTGVATLYDWAKSIFGFTKAEADEAFSNQVSSLMDAPLSFLGVGLTSTTSFLTGLFLSFIYIFLFLLYRSGFKDFLLIQASKVNRPKLKDLIDKVQKLIQKYLYGLLLVILILGVLNSIGLWVIGIKHPLFWGFLAAMLAVIPYIGTFIGGALPFLYALATAGEMWQPVAVVVLFITVQTLEGNFITPNVIGSSVKINPLAAIVSLLVGAKIWGIAGMVLSLPVISIIKEILKSSEAWRPVGFLLSDEIGEKEQVFKVKWDKERFRLRHFFRKRN